MRIAVIQHDVAWLDPTATFANVAPMVQHAVDDGATAIVLPEMFATGFCMTHSLVTPHAAAIYAWVKKCAQDSGVTMIAGIGMPDAASGLGQNVSVVIGPDGVEKGRYRKTHPFTHGNEPAAFPAGNALSVITMPDGLRVGLTICYDLRFPELYRELAPMCDVIVNQASWPTSRIHHWRSLLVARAIENQCFIVGSNRVGADGNGLDHGGTSIIVTPTGEPRDEARRDPAIVFADLDATEVSTVRANLPFLSDKRPLAFYAALARPA